MAFNQPEQHFADLFTALHTPPAADFQRHMHEGVILPAVGHLPGVQPDGAAADATQREDAGSGQRLIDLGEQAG